VTDHERREAAWQVFQAMHPALPPRATALRALVKESFTAGWLAAELVYRKEPG
jgi:nicotinamide mononucleotide (NMN) deamidase PncC